LTHKVSAPAAANGEGRAHPALAEPEVRPISLALQAPAVTGPAAAAPVRLEEVLWAGPAGEELRDCTVRYNSDGSVRETVVYFYGDDQRAGSSQAGEPLRREALYLGRADVKRLYAVRKVSDTFHVGPAGHERRDLRIEYQADGRVARTVLFHYEGDLRAAEAPSGSALRRQVVYEGRLP
jgi:hypothetical protein